MVPLTEIKIKLLDKRWLDKIVRIMTFFYCSSKNCEMEDKLKLPQCASTNPALFCIKIIPNSEYSKNNHCFTTIILVHTELEYKSSTRDVKKITCFKRLQ